MPLFINGLNMAVVAVWSLHVEIGELSDHLEFRRQIVNNTIQRLDKPPTALSDSHSVSDIRFDGVDHYLGSKCRTSEMSMV